ncbi:MAG: hypothetical protein LQ343_006067 [Gyalolechia ehrenbergii]|nr:MAG: hypothetical protein LQ343_006067 [Gyalolechia ehrenbergii]
MYVSVPKRVLSIAIAFSPLCVVGAPRPQPQFLKQVAPTGPGNEFMGSLTWYPQQPDLVLASISNNSTTTYALLAKNNLFDDAHPYAPFQVRTLSGTPVKLVGKRWPYPEIADTQFKDFAPGAIWQRYFNMSLYMPPSAQYQQPTSECFSFSLPATVDALARDPANPNVRLADLFLSEGLSQVSVSANPIHMNVTVPAATGTASAPEVSQAIPSQPAGVILAPDQQSGQIVNLLDSGQVVNATTFEIAKPDPAASTSQK